MPSQRTELGLQLRDLFLIIGVALAGPPHQGVGEVARQGGIFFGIFVVAHANHFAMHSSQNCASEPSSLNSMSGTSSSSILP